MTGTVLGVQSIHYPKYPQESPEGGVVCPILQMWKLKLGGLSWPGMGRAGFGPLVLLALKFVPSTTLPLVQFDISSCQCNQGLTLLIAVCTHIALPFLPPLPDMLRTHARTHTQLITHFTGEPFSRPNSPRLSCSTAETTQGRAHHQQHHT